MEYRSRLPGLEVFSYREDIPKGYYRKNMLGMNFILRFGRI